MELNRINYWLDHRVGGFYALKPVKKEITEENHDINLPKFKKLKV